MRILGIESSCDETAAAIVENGERLLSNVVNSQIDIHAQYGGVVPEVAARSHVEVINPVVTEALAQANLSWDSIDAIAVTYAPGLSGSLLIGALTAKTLAYLYDKPLYAIHHVEAHVYANFVTKQGPDASSFSFEDHDFPSVASQKRQLHQIAESGPEKPNKAQPVPLSLKLPATQPAFPLLALIVSGGHTQLVLFRDHGDYTLLGHTQDDAVGEAFDKVAKIIGLPYPGGPSIAKAALNGDAQKFKLPKAKLKDPYNFSFSGLKTAVLRAVQAEVGVDFTFPSTELPGRLNEATRNDFAASFQRTAIETLVDKTEKAYQEFQPASVVIAGGVAANEELRRQLSARLPLDIQYAPMQLCTDNAAMIATLAFYQAQTQPPISPFELDIQPSLSMQR